MPFCTVPTFSNRFVIVLRIHPDIWFSRITSPLATAISPTVIAPRLHSAIDSAAVPSTSAVFRTVSVTVMFMIERIRFRNARVWRRMPTAANSSSSAWCAKSLTDWMLV